MKNAKLEEGSLEETSFPFLMQLRRRSHSNCVKRTVLALALGRDLGFEIFLGQIKTSGFPQIQGYVGLVSLGALNWACGVYLNVLVLGLLAQRPLRSQAIALLLP